MSAESSIIADIEGQFLGSLEAEHHLDKFAEQVRDYAKELAPVFGDLPPKRNEPEHGEPGDYKESITVSPIKHPGKRRVGSKDFKAIWIELGSRHMPEYAVFAKTAAYFGGTGPVFEEGIVQAQGRLREHLETLAKLGATGATAAALAEQHREVGRARQARSSAFKAARGPRRRR